VFNENGNVAGIQNSNNAKAFYDYDGAGKLKNLKLFKCNGGNLGNYNYSYDANSNINSVSITSDSLGSSTISFTYDGLNRLTSETLKDGTLIEYTYDAAGNRLTKKIGANTTNYSYDDANELTAVGGTSYTYDYNGNLTNNGTRTFEYDPDNRLIRITNNQGETLVASFEYDGLGRRTSKTYSQCDRQVLL
jgi:YD repeat-containing protein